MTPTPVNEDYSDMLSALNGAGVEFLVVGAYALGAHGNPRSTGDIDFWVRPTQKNASRVWQALAEFGAPRSGVTKADFAARDTIFQIGVPPRRIDLLTSISGVSFEAAWNEKVASSLGDTRVWVLSRQHLLTNKLASGRPKDLADADWLKRTGESRGERD